MKQKYLALAISAIVSVGLVGCGSDSDKNYIPPTNNPGTPEVPETPETPETPEGPTTGDEDNIGNAAEGNLDLRSETTVGGQQYVRGENAEFDKTLNPNSANKGNATVLNGITLQNKNLDNIVIGRETVQRVDGPEAAIRFAGEAVDGISNVSSANTLTLQQYNTDGGTRLGADVTTTVPQTSTTSVYPTVLDYRNSNGELIQENGVNLYVASTTEDTGFPIYDPDGNQVIDADDNLLFAATVDVTVPGESETITGSGINVTDASFAKNGLVNIVVANPTNADNGTEAQSTTGTRIFGKNYRDVANTGVNSHQFVAATDANTGTLKITGFDDASFKKVKLNNVQYGRVTSDIDKLDDDQVSTVDGVKYYESKIVDKGGKDSVDTYFYRGTGETTIAQMNALKEAGGTFQYAGHALMYGIDNSYHGALGDPNSNSFGGTDKAVEGKGNFVNATVNMTDRNVTGNVFNVWQVKPEGSENLVYRQDNLVDFKGNIFGNTVKGDANLSYKTDSKGTFKGTFFGDKGQELGGALNSVQNGYGNAAWGGVFGAQRVDAPKPEVPGDGNANQTE